MGRPHGGHPRGVCDYCGESVAVRLDGQPIPHGPVSDRCIGGIMPISRDVQLPPSRWDRSTGRAGRGATVEERMRNAAALCAAVRGTVHTDVLTDAQFLADTRAELERAGETP